MTLAQRLHKSATHQTGFDPNCPQCLKDDGIDGIIEHLTKCVVQNTRDSDSRTRDGLNAIAVANEQRRMLAILKAYRMYVLHDLEPGKSCR